MNVVLLPLNICMIMHLSTFYVFKYLASALYVCMFMFMGLVARMFGVWQRPLHQLKGRRRYSVVSKLKLQHGPEWAMKDQLAEVGFLLPSRDQKFMTENFHKMFLIARTISSSKNLVGSSSDAAES